MKLNTASSKAPLPLPEVENQVDQSTLVKSSSLRSAGIVHNEPAYADQQTPSVVECTDTSNVYGVSRLPRASTSTPQSFFDNVTAPRLIS